MTDLPEDNDRQLNRPRISFGSMVGFSTVAFAVLSAGAASVFWIGGLDTRVSDLKSQLDRSDRDAAAFTSEMRLVLKEASKSLADLSLEVAKMGASGGPPRHR